MTWINLGAYADHASSKSHEGSRRYSPAPYDLAISDSKYFNCAEPTSFSEMMLSKLHV